MRLSAVRLAYPLSLVALLLLTLTLHPLNAQPRPDAPAYALPGPYAVGVQDVILPGMADRNLPVSVWYPTSPAPVTEGEAPAAVESPTYRSGFFGFAAGTAVRDAAPDITGAPYPLIVFSHGSGALRALSLTLMEHLVSHGYVVIAADHVSNTAVDEALNGDAFRAALGRNYVYRPDDVLRLIAHADTLTAPDGALAGVIDTDQIVVAGHSFGGYTAIAAAGGQLDPAGFAAWCEQPTGYSFSPDAASPFNVIESYGEDEAERYNACFLLDSLPEIAELRGYETVPTDLLPPVTDARIRAVIAYAPWNAPIFGAEGLANVTVPALMIVGSTDGTTPPERDAYTFYNHLGSTDKTLVVLDNADHFVYIDSCYDFMLQFEVFYACSDPVWDMPRAHDLINHFTTAFLLKVLAANTDAAAALTPQAVTPAEFRAVHLVTTSTP